MDSTAKTKAAESLLLTLVSVRVLRLSVSVHEPDCGPASSCPKKPECDLMQTSEVKLRIIQGHRQVQSWKWAWHPHYPQLSTHQPGASLSPHSQWDMFQLANLTNCLLCPSLPLPSPVPYSALLNAFFYPSYFSRFLPWCVSCMSCVCSKAQISERYQARFHWAIKLNNGVCVLLSASAFNFFRVVGGEPVVRMEMTSINKVEKRSKSYYATCVCMFYLLQHCDAARAHLTSWWPVKKVASLAIQQTRWGIFGFIVL